MSNSGHASACSVTDDATGICKCDPLARQKWKWKEANWIDREEQLVGQMGS